MRRAIVIATVFAGVVFLAGAAVAVDPYSGTLSGGNSSDNPADPGDNVTVTGGGFQPGTGVLFSLQGTTLCNTTANSSGNASCTFTVPSLDPGCYTVTAPGRDANANATPTDSTTVCVRAAGATTLGFTGADNVWRNAGIGGMLVLLATGLVLFARRRRLTRATN